MFFIERFVLLLFIDEVRLFTSIGPTGKNVIENPVKSGSSLSNINKFTGRV
jgi:hypothetical protein